MRIKLAKLYAAWAGLALVCAGCTGASAPESSTLGSGGGRVNIAGPVQPIDPDQIERVDLIALLDPKGLRNLAHFKPGVPPDRGSTLLGGTVGTMMVGAGDGGNTAAPIDPSSELALAITAFYYQSPDQPFNLQDTNQLEVLKFRRNYIMNAIITASDQRCNVYIGYLYRSKASNDFILGSLSTLLGGLGAIFTAPDVVRTLSGSSAIFGGIRAEHNQAYFDNLATRVIIQGITAARLEDLGRIRGTKTEEEMMMPVAMAAPEPAPEAAKPATPAPAPETGKPATPAPAAGANAASPPATKVKVMKTTGGYMSLSITDYPITAAIGDAIRYYGLCSVTTGLEHASKSIDAVANPGPEIQNKVLDSLTTTQAKVKNLVNKVKEGG